MISHLLRMRKALGSIPSVSIRLYPSSGVLFLKLGKGLRTGHASFPCLAPKMHVLLDVRSHSTAPCACSFHAKRLVSPLNSALQLPHECRLPDWTCHRAVLLANHFAHVIILVVPMAKTMQIALPIRFPTLCALAATSVLWWRFRR